VNLMVSITTNRGSPHAHVFRVVAEKKIHRLPPVRGSRNCGGQPARAIADARGTPRCPTCGGAGTIACPDCEGSGQIRGTMGEIE